MHLANVMPSFGTHYASAKPMPLKFFRMNVKELKCLGMIAATLQGICQKRQKKESLSALSHHFSLVTYET